MANSERYPQQPLREVMAVWICTGCGKRHREERLVAAGDEVPLFDLPDRWFAVDGMPYCTNHELRLITFGADAEHPDVRLAGPTEEPQPEDPHPVQIQVGDYVRTRNGRIWTVNALRPGEWLHVVSVQDARLIWDVVRASDVERLDS